MVRSAYRDALEGFALPYGDITVGGWRNTPYVVIQNVGAYLDVPRFLDSDHPIENAADAEAYLAAPAVLAKQLDGELGRMQAARGKGLVPPAFLIDKALAQMRCRRRTRAKAAALVESIERRTKNIPRQLGRARADDRAQEVAPALERQIAELQASARRRPWTPACGRGRGRRILPVGAQGLDHHRHDAGRGPRDGPRASCASCTRGWTPS